MRRSCTTAALACRHTTIECRQTQPVLAPKVVFFSHSVGEAPASESEDNGPVSSSGGQSDASQADDRGKTRWLQSHRERTCAILSIHRALPADIANRCSPISGFNANLGAAACSAGLPQEDQEVKIEFFNTKEKLPTIISHGNSENGSSLCSSHIDSMCSSRIGSVCRSQHATRDSLPELGCRSQPATLDSLPELHADESFGHRYSVRTFDSIPRLPLCSGCDDDSDSSRDQDEHQEPRDRKSVV